MCALNIIGCQLSSYSLFFQKHFFLPAGKMMLDISKMANHESLSQNLVDGGAGVSHVRGMGMFVSQFKQNLIGKGDQSKQIPSFS